MKSAAARPARRLIAILFAVLGVAIAVVLVLAVVDLLRIRADINDGKGALTNLDFATIDRQGGVVHITQQAGAEIHRAAELANSSPWLSVLSHVPAVGNQVKAVRELTQAADHVGALGVSVATDVQAALDDASGRGPAGRVALIDSLSAASDRLQEGLRTIDVGGRGWLVPGLSGARHDLQNELTKADTRLDDGRRSLATLKGFLIGPSRYLILGGNNAEMRSMGIATTSGAANIRNGEVKVGQFVRAEATQIAKPGVPLPDGWDFLFGYLDPGIAYSNMVASPNFPLTGQVATALSAANKYHHVDGVIYVDTITLQRLLAVVGPVTVDGVTYNEHNAVRILIHTNYLTFQDRDVRVEQQGAVAKAIFDALNTRSVSFVKLAAALQDLAQQRHLAVYSSKPDEQALWHDIGADGERSPNDLLVTSQDLGASKLDYVVTASVDMHVAATKGGRRIQLSITLTNPSRTATSDHIEGGSIFANPGEYGSYVVVFAPGDAYDFDDTDPNWTSFSRDGALQATTFTVRIPEGQTHTVHVAFTLPSDETTLHIVPSARVVPELWNNDGTQFVDFRPRTLDLGSIRVGNDSTAVWMILGLLFVGVGAAITGAAWGRGSHIDAGIGWWLTVCGVAMVAVQITIFVVP